MNWYIGQKVVYVGKDKKFHNTIWQIKQIRQGCCRILFDIGLPPFESWNMCRLCGFVEHFNVLWKEEATIRPLEDNFATEVLENALKEGKKLDLEVKV